MISLLLNAIRDGVISFPLVHIVLLISSVIGTIVALRALSYFADDYLIPYVGIVGFGFLIFVTVVGGLAFIVTQINALAQRDR